MVGCSKDELIDETSENNQLKRGSTGNTGVASLSFVGKSVEEENPFILDGLLDQGGQESIGNKIMRNGICSGSITGYGKINPLLSSYKFTNCIGKENPGYSWISLTGQINRTCSHMYDMDGYATICINFRDMFTIEFTDALLVPYNYEPYFFGTNESVFYGALFGCRLNNQGAASVTNAKGTCAPLQGRIVEFGNGACNTINRETGVMNLKFTIR